VHVVEVGPGPGDLTHAILEQHPKSMSLIEIDADMVPLIMTRFQNENIQLYHSDVLKIDIKKTAKQNINVKNISLSE